MSKLSQTTFDAANKIWSGLKREPVLNPKANLGQLILDVLGRTPNKVTQISDDSGVEVTCKQMRTRSIRVAQNLTRLGCVENDVVCMATKNSELVAPVIFGCFLVGAPINTIDPYKDCFMHLMELTKPKFVFCDSEDYAAIRKCLDSLKLTPEIVVFGKHIEGTIPVEELLQTQGDDEIYLGETKTDSSKLSAVIMCSSGTTGLAKGISLSHAQCAVNFYKLWDTQGDESVLFCFSAVWVLTGFGTIIFGTLCGAKRVITTKPYTSEYQLELIDKHSITDLVTAPFFTDLMLKCPNFEKYDISSLQNCLIGGSAVSASLKQRMQAKLSKNGMVLPLYAMTEMAGLISISYPTDDHKSVGQLVPRAQAKIIDDNGVCLGVGCPGEICLRSSFMFLGYYGNVAATKTSLDADNWLHTGDIGYFNEQGLLFLIDRIKNIVKYNGFFIAPTEIEALIEKLEGVKSVCVIGIDDLLTAVVVKSLGSALTAQNVTDYVAQHVEDHKRIRGGVFFVDDLPVFTSGKVQRKMIQELATKLFNDNKEI